MTRSLLESTVVPPGGILLAPSYVLGLDEPGAYATIPAISAYDFGTGDFSVEVWCAGVQGGPLAALVTAAGPLLSVTIAANGDIVVLEGATRVVSVGQPTLVTDGNWHLVSVTRASGTLTIYLDGVQLATAAECTPFAITGVTAFLMGAASTVAQSPTYLGTYADVRLWNSARTQAQVQQAMCYRLPAGAPVVGYWTFVGQSLTDYSSNQNNGGSIVGSGSYTFVPISYYPSIGCLQLDGASSSVAIGGNAAYNFGTGDFTLEAWLQPVSSGTLLARTTGSGTGTIGFALSVNANGLLNFMTSDGTHTTNVTQTAAMDAFLTVWHHVSVTRQSSVITIYVDGVPVASGTESTPTSINVPAATPLLLGNISSKGQSSPVPGSPTDSGVPAGTSPFILQLAELRLWNRAVSQNDVYRGMLIESHGDEPGLAGYWNFSTGNIIDRSNTRNLSVQPYTATIGTPAQPISLAQYVLDVPGSGYMTAPYVKAFDFGTGDFTLETRFSATGAGTLMSRPFVSSLPSCGMQMRVDATTLTLTLASASASNTYTASIAILDGAWHHVAWRRTGGVLSAFVDDVLIACTPTASLQDVTTPSNFVVGANFDVATSTYSDTITGQIDFVILWNTARELAELQSLSYLDPGGAVQEAVGAWSFDQQAPIDQSRSNSNGMLGSGASIIANSTLAVTVPLSTAHLSGVTSCVDCSARTDLSFGGLQPYTMGAWIKPMSANTNGTIISRYDTAGSSEYRLRIVNGVPVAERAASNGVVTGVTKLQADW
ncbi:MAG: LamG domain-containing protein, partial [Vulcanimicrobiaceae bacterium]